MIMTTMIMTIMIMTIMIMRTAMAIITGIITTTRRPTWAAPSPSASD